MVALTVLLVAHEVGDHVLQTDHQASAKAALRGGPAARAMAGHLAYRAYGPAACSPRVPLLDLPARWPQLAAGLLFSAATHGLLDRRWPVRAILRGTRSGAFAAATHRRCGLYAAGQALHHLASTRLGPAHRGLTGAASPAREPPPEWIRSMFAWCSTKNGYLRAHLGERREARSSPSITTAVALVRIAGDLHRHLGLGHQVAVPESEWRGAPAMEAMTSSRSPSGMNTIRVVREKEGKSSPVPRTTAGGQQQQRRPASPAVAPGKSSMSCWKYALILFLGHVLHSHA